MTIPNNYKSVVKKGVVASIAAGPLGAFAGPFDAGAIGTLWTTMFIAIADKAGHKLDADYIKKFIASSGTGAAAYYAGCKVATWVFHLIPGAGTLLAMGISSLMNSIFTLKFGSVIANSFEKDDFELDDAAVAAASVLSALCTLPTLSEWKELFEIRRLTTT